MGCFLLALKTPVSVTCSQQGQVCTHEVVAESKGSSVSKIRWPFPHGLWKKKKKCYSDPCNFTKVSKLLSVTLWHVTVGFAPYYCSPSKDMLLVTLYIKCSQMCVQYNSACNLTERFVRPKHPTPECFCCAPRTGWWCLGSRRAAQRSAACKQDSGTSLQPAPCWELQDLSPLLETIIPHRYFR